MSEKIVIAIDGPAGSGKSTIAKILAEKLKFLYLDTGAMYRAVTFLALRHNVLNNTEQLIQLTKEINIGLEFTGKVTKVFVNGEEVTDEIRTPEVNRNVSKVAAVKEIREELAKQQQQIGNVSNLVTEGRDTTTVVFPGADIKIFLTADVNERAKRRFKELSEKGVNTTFEETLESLMNRDKIDSSREASPLLKSDDAILMDTTNLSVNDELEKIEKLVEEIKNAKSRPE